MNKIQSITIVSIILILVSSCGYQNMNSSNQKAFNIQEFDITGDSRVSFIIQKKFNVFQMRKAKIELSFLSN